MTNPTETHPCIAHACPFCGADAGTPCVARTSGKEQDWPHSRRIALTQTAEERNRNAPVRVNALCCECGNLRTVSSHYSRRNDPNRSYSPEGRSKGWSFTRTLKCGACNRDTRHAELRPTDAPYRDADEQRQLVALGDDDTSEYGHLADLERIRREYREMPFPRNPNLRHRFDVDAATKVWDEGKRKLIAVCGEFAAIETDPRTWGEYRNRKEAARQKRYGGFVVAEQLSDIEYTDLETGLEWIDMDCVDCCRVSNARRMKQTRERMAWFLKRLFVYSAEVPGTEVIALEQELAALWDRMGKA